MTRTRSRALGLLAALALIAAAPTASGTAGSSPSITAAKSCSSGFKHAVLPWGHKCLRRGQYCKKSGDRYYHRYGYHCHSGRLR